jgi:hypothetical protein
MRRAIIILALAALSAPALAGEERLGRSMSDGVYGFFAHGPRFGVPYVYFGYDDRWGPRVFSRDDGYFQGRGYGVSLSDGRAIFDYDRDYPYDFPGSELAGGSGIGSRDHSEVTDGDEHEDAPDCELRTVPDRRSGKTAEVRVCR